MDPAQLQPGYRLDRYELLCPLAHGGMATVWLARIGSSFGFEQLFVVKMILPQYSQDPMFRSMFIDEARIASQIEHPNVARIQYVGEHLGNYFMVLEWVDGDSVSKILRGAEQRGERIPFGVAARILADAASGLHAAHELKDRDGASLGVVHRDVSPQNVLVSNDGATKIIDFGVAKAKDRVSHTTSAGQLKGKIRYMAPEQALGRELDHRADVWALGAIFYEMLTGKPPYEAGSEIATLHRLTSGVPALPIPRAVPAAFRMIAERAVAFDPDRRFASARELSLALEEAMLETDQRTTELSVAHYAGDLLADRKASRRRALDAALLRARDRTAGGAPPPPHAVPSPPLSGHEVPASVSHGSLSHGKSHGSWPGSALWPRDPSWPNAPSVPHPSAPTVAPPASGLGEAPTQPSTLGSANIAYVGATSHGARTHRRRLLGTAALGATLAAVGVCGILLFTAVKRDAPASRTAADLPPPTAVDEPAAPPPAHAPAPPNVPPVELSSPEEAEGADHEEQELAAPSASAPVASAAPAARDDQAGAAEPTPPKAAPAPATPKPAAPKPATPQAAAPSPPPSPPAPTPKPAPTSTWVDRGF